MFYSHTRLLSLFTSTISWSVHIRAGPAPRTPLGDTYHSSPTVVAKSSYNASRLGSVAGTASSGLYGQTNTTVWSASPVSLDPGESARMQAKVCLAGHCSGYTAATKTVDDAIAGLGGPLTMLPDSELQAGCVLWNVSCLENKTAARDYFFGTLRQHLNANACFTKPAGDCTKIESPARMSEFQAIQDWMRSPQCYSDHAGYNSMVGMPAPVQDTENCCGTCGLTAGIVDIYYWPAANASTSCLDIVGTDINPLTYGATIGPSSDGYNFWNGENGELKSSLPTYWGCTTETAGQLSFMGTALITEINSITFKQYIINPWSTPSCVGSSSPSPKPNGALPPRASIRAQAHSLPIHHNTTTQVGGSPASTVVVSGFTFTSPSVYANFKSISGFDECGSQTISLTMLSFAPGGLSTIEGGMGCADCTSQSTKPFDFQDLPCPPQSVMEANWYKPEPGEPYRPRIAMPDQIRKVNPFFGRCTDAFFSGFDPPKTLLPATAMTPTTTAADPNAATSVALMPSATQDPGAKKTASGDETKPATGATPARQDPKETANMAPGPKQNAPTPVPQPKDSTSSKGSPAQPGPSTDGTNSDPKQTSDAKPGSRQATALTTTSSDPKQGSGVNRDPGQVTDLTANSGTSGDPGQNNNPGSPAKPKEPSNPPHISDPSNISPNQMSQIENALVPSTQGPQAVPTSVQGIDSGSNQHGWPSGDVPMSQGSFQAENSQNMPNNGSPQQNPALSALQSIGDSIPIKGPPATTMSVSNHVLAVGPSGVRFDDSQVASDQAQVVASSVMAMNPSAGAVSSNYFVNTPSPMQHPEADIQPATVYQPTIINGESAQRIANGIFIAGATITAGASPLTIAGIPVVVGSSSVIIGASTIPLATAFPEQVVSANAANYHPTTIIGQIAQPVSNGVSIAGAILAQGAPPITLSGTPVSVGSSGLAMGSITVPLAAVFTNQIPPTVPKYQPTSIHGEKAQLVSNGGISIAGTTLTAGGLAVTVSGIPVSAGSSSLVIGSSKVPLAAAFPSQIAPTTALHQPTTINGEKAQILPNGISIAGATLIPGAPAITISGTQISIGSSGLVLGTGNPIPLTRAFPEQIVTTLASQAITILPTAAEIAGATLTPGAPAITISGVPIYMGSSGLIVGTNNVLLISKPQETTVANQVVTTLAGEAITAVPSAVEVAGTTLTPGASGVTLSGTLVSLNTAGGLVLGSQTIAVQSESVGLSGLIMAPFATPSASSATGIGNGTGGLEAFEGKATSMQVPSLLKWASALLVAIFIFVHIS